MEEQLSPSERAGQGEWDMGRAAPDSLTHVGLSSRCGSLQNELFEKAKNEILDEVISLSQVTPQHW